MALKNTSKILVPSSIGNRLLPAHAVNMADHLIKLKTQNPLDIWVVVDAVLEAWKQVAPREWDSFIVSTEATRGTRANKHGSNDKEGLRYTVDMPEWVMAVMRQLYTPDELPMDKEFFKRFWRRYPAFRVSETS